MSVAAGPVLRVEGGAVRVFHRELGEQIAASSQTSWV